MIFFFFVSDTLSSHKGRAIRIAAGNRLSRVVKVFRCWQNLYFLQTRSPFLRNDRRGTSCTGTLGIAIDSTILCLGMHPSLSPRAGVEISADGHKLEKKEEEIRWKCAPGVSHNLAGHRLE